MKLKKVRILARLTAPREAKPKHFWAYAGVAGVSLFSMVAAFGVAPNTAQTQLSQQTVVEQLALRPLDAEVDAAVFVREEHIQRGDTVGNLLSRLGVQDPQALVSLRQNKDMQALFEQLRPGKTVTARTDENGELVSLVYPLNGKDSALLVERRNGKLQATEQNLPLEKRVQLKSAEIHSSLFGATDAAGLPDSVATQIADIFGGEIDFHRDLRRGDRFSVVYEMIYYQGQPVRAGRILATEFINENKHYSAIWFDSGDGNGGYYDKDGKSLRKAFLRSPLEFSRITSGFSMRFHPILQTWRAHKGVDYGAPTGTRVKATADGTVEFAGRQNGYGNIVVLRHQGKYTTHYGHLSGFVAGMKKGTRVSQGNVIGYVGSTGWATGPHLHYEFRINDIHQNPLSIALPTAQPLTMQKLAEFRNHADPLLAQLKQVNGLNLAQLD